MILTDDKIEAMADKICTLVYQSVDEYNEKHDEQIDACDVCPFTNYCAIGQTGFAEFFKQEINK